MSTPTITLNQLITLDEAKELVAYVKMVESRQKATKHNIILKFLDSKPEIVKRFAAHGVLRAYGAYLFEALLFQ